MNAYFHISAPLIPAHRDRHHFRLTKLLSEPSQDELMCWLQALIHAGSDWLDEEPPRKPSPAAELAAQRTCERKMAFLHVQRLSDVAIKMSVNHMRIRWRPVWPPAFEPHEPELATWLASSSRWFPAKMLFKSSWNFFCCCCFGHYFHKDDVIYIICVCALRQI